MDGTVLAAVSMVPGVVFAGEGGHLVAVATGIGKNLFGFNTGARIYWGTIHLKRYSLR
ncbi:MAG: hypothetical protein M3Y76_09365 [Chloroflexota bacterium]|nr:hypothetical protein [Chloroflexota bacterium]